MCNLLRYLRFLNYSMKPTYPAPRLAVFDIDGTLTDSVAIHQKAFVQALAAFGCSGFSTDWGSYKHHTDSYIFKTILEQQYGRDIAPEDMDQFGALLHQHIEQYTREQPVTEISGAAAFLEKLPGYGYDIVFATGSLLAPARLKLLQAGISHPEALIITADRMYAREELVLAAIAAARQFYGVAQYETVISFGDGIWDYETARKVNIDFIGIGNPKLLASGITAFHTDFSDPAAFRLQLS